jgi:hypothetical protein
VQKFRLFSKSFQRRNYSPKSPAQSGLLDQTVTRLKGLYYRACKMWSASYHSGRERIVLVTAGLLTVVVVCIAIRFEMDSPRIEPRWDRDFPHPSLPALWFTQPPIQGARLFPGCKVAGAWRWPSTLISALRLKREERYTSTHSLGLYGLFWGELYIYLVEERRIVFNSACNSLCLA